MVPNIFRSTTTLWWRLFTTINVFETHARGGNKVHVKEQISISLYLYSAHPKQLGHVVWYDVGKHYKS